MSDIEAVINLHREGALARPSLASAVACAKEARGAGLSCSITLVLDRSDAATSRLADEFAASR